MIVTGDDKEEIAKLKGLLSTEFDLKDLGKLKYFLGIEIARSSITPVLNQRKYTLDLLKETGKLGCRPASTPIDVTRLARAGRTGSGSRPGPELQAHEEPDARASPSPFPLFSCLPPERSRVSAERKAATVQAAAAEVVPAASGDGGGVGINYTVGAFFVTHRQPSSTGLGLLGWKMEEPKKGSIVCKTIGDDEQVGAGEISVESGNDEHYVTRWLEKFSAAHVLTAEFSTKKLPEHFKKEGLMPLLDFHAERLLDARLKEMELTLCLQTSKEVAALEITGIMKQRAGNFVFQLPLLLQQTRSCMMDGGILYADYHHIELLPAILEAIEGVTRRTGLQSLTPRLAKFGYESSKPLVVINDFNMKLKKKEGTSKGHTKVRREAISRTKGSLT
ncbi:Uncharacterized protein EJ110_NYTH59705 [Nymphaea thermarum]|nr:Uncharacterized protein EJ110_NYTH59705 [Nymphaea thermarum]